VQEGADARRSVEKERMRTTSRRELQRRRRFQQLSPAPGVLDEDAFSEAMEQDLDDALALLADLAGATDPALRELARRLAGRVMVRLGRSGRARAGATGRMAPARLMDGGDLDVDASMEEIVDAAAARRSPHLGDLRSRAWSRPAPALCLLVDRSGSMGGRRLASAALAAAAVSWRAGTDYSVVAFSDDAVVVKGQVEERPVEAVVDDLLALRGHGTTNLALALTVAREQLLRSSSPDRVTLLLSDGRATAGDDPAPAARALDRLLILAPRGDSGEARGLAAAAGARAAEVDGPSEIPGALAALLGG
jgi:Mg-chelatase subunit ChlD